MMRTNLNRALAFAAVMLLASSATAQEPTGNADKAEKKVEKAGDKAAKSADKAADKVEDKAKLAERDARKTAEHAAQKAKLAASLKASPDDSLRTELRLHAERVARLERIKSLATEAKDKESEEKAKKLLEKENARHEKWMGKIEGGSTTTTADPMGAKPADPMGAKPGEKPNDTTGAKPATPTTAAPKATTENKGGAK